MENKPKSGIETQKSPSMEAMLLGIASELGFHESDEMRDIRERVNNFQNEDDSIEYIAKYMEMVQDVEVDNELSGEKIRQIDTQKLIVIAATKYRGGFLSESLEDVDGALDYFYNETLARLLETYRKE